MTTSRAIFKHFVSIPHPFLSHGRTEVTRTVTTASEAFVKAMGPEAVISNRDSAVQLKTVILMSKAIAAHMRYTRMAAKAMGVDRHFFGLSMVAGQGELPKLFSDPVFLRSKKWRSSTSQLSHPFINVWGYGAVVPDGVGLAYSIHPTSCVFCVTGQSAPSYLFPEKLFHHLDKALDEMKQLVLLRQKETSKL